MSRIKIQVEIHKWAIALLLCGLVFRGLIANFLPPGYDEAYYYAYTLHPNLSYFDHPLLVSFVTGFGVWLTGDVSQFTIRLGAVLLYTGTLLFFYLTSDRLFGRKTALLTLAIATFIPFFQVGFGILVLPDSPLMFFWSACLYLVAQEFFDPVEKQENIQQEQDEEMKFSASLNPYTPTYRLALIGLLVGLACLGKYHGFLLGLGLIIFCLLSPRHRPAFTSPWTGAAFLLFFAAIAPLLIWNAQHDWVSFRFQSARAVPQAGYNLEGLLVTFLAGVGYLFPTFGFPLWWVSLRKSWYLLKSSKYKIHQLNLDSNQQKQVFILAVSLPVFLGFTLMGGYRQVLPSWHMPGFFGATLLLGQQAAIAQQKNAQRIRNWLWGSGITIVVLMTVALLHVSDGLVQKGGNHAILGGFWAAKDDPSTQLVDLSQLRQGFVNSPLLSKALAESDFVFSNSFFLGGQVVMAIAPLTPKPITCFDQDLRGFAFWDTAQDFVGKNGIYITSELFQEPLTKYEDYFQSITKLADVPIVRGGEAVQIFHIYRATNMLKPYPRPYGI